MINIRRITKENWVEAASILSGAMRKAPFEEEWTMSAAYSLLQATYERESDCALISENEKAIGFIFYSWYEEKKAPLLCRYIIDVKYQGKGYGQAALPKVTDFLCDLYDSDILYLILDPENKRAVHICERFGFHPVGETNEGETVYAWEK